MMGDTGSRQDIADSHAFLSGLVTRWPRMHLSTCLDAGAGVGRVTKHLLLRHCRTVHLVESFSKWSRLSRGYLGKKRSKACTFTQARIETFVPRPGSIDLVWVQWVLQYLTDADAVQTLRNLASGLAPHGVVVLKENCPYLITCDVRMFQCDTPAGENARYDITRPDKHHRILFERAGLEVLETETTAVETNFWVLQRRKQKKQNTPVLVLATTGAGKKTKNKNKKHARLKKKGKMKKK